MSKYDLVLYDLDGTLQDSVPLIMESMKASYEIVLGGTDRTDEDMMSFIGKPLTDTFWMHDEETKAKLIEAYLDYNCTRMKQNVVPIFPGVYDFLAKIRSMGVKQGIVTSKLESSAMITIDLWGWDSISMTWYSGKQRKEPSRLAILLSRPRKDWG